MSESILIDSLEFAREKRSLSGEVPVSELARTHESLLNDSGTIRYSLLGGQDIRERATLTLYVSGSVVLLCQRCLQPLKETIDSQSVLTQFADEQAIEIASEEDPELEGIVADKRLDVLALIEDEILLSLPVSPKHESCGPALADEKPAGKPNPFAVLKQLKQSN
ncbi:YceD family protein [Chitinivorax sp. PXF-14]|uniref:YceD family protein n=1 Tax=Chitinivorax sp. PXF-14 TaxID=3230488 RepID=UPI003467A594